MTEPRTTRLADYQPPAFLVDTADLVFLLEASSTIVKARLAIRKNPRLEGTASALWLDGDGLHLTDLRLDDQILTIGDYMIGATGLSIADVPDSFVLDIETLIDPQANTELSGLYRSGGNFCTQCEAEGFRRITYFPDRPDVMTRFTVTLVADAEGCPVLLSNGNPVDRGILDGRARHWAKWEDPHPKPSYLFALVAGNLIATRDRFVTRNGRPIDLAIWVKPGDETKCDHAMYALKQAMRWDEDVFGLEYDLDVFNIVAVPDFNMGAMENKGLNVFNTKYILAAPATATDGDYQGIETVVAHEYFHNWTGNRVTCRDWFQLSLKEGLTVFRDQEFSADQGSRAVKRILDVRRLRASQFPEDDGPLAHPVRPDSYIEINNFYTATVYQKGAELVRMIHTLVGAAGFRRGMDLYIARHDNSAATIEDFVGAMQDASGIDFAPFRLWYAQAGTPVIAISHDYDAARQTYTLTLRQDCPPTPGQPVKLPLVIPLLMGLLDSDGNVVPTRLEGETDTLQGDRLLILDEVEQSFVFTDVAKPPVPSLLRGYSAPVKLTGLKLGDLGLLAEYDPDPFARWDAGQLVAARLLEELVAQNGQGTNFSIDPWYLDVFETCLQDAVTDPAFVAEMLTLPSESFIADQMAVIDPTAIHTARRFLRQTIGRKLRSQFVSLYESLDQPGPYRIDGTSIGKRSLRNIALAYLAAGDAHEGEELAAAQLRVGQNMTDTLAALSILADIAGPAREEALAAFHETWRHDQLVTDKWFAIQAASSLPDTIDRVRTLLTHPDFDIRNPNRVRALLGSFAMVNLVRFHEAGGAGYSLLADQIIAIDGFNSQLAARMIVPICSWRRHNAHRQDLMKQTLRRILAQPSLSKGTFEMASKSLA